MHPPGAKRTAKTKSGAKTAEYRDAQVEQRSFPIVGIGASAGGLEAFTELINQLPGDTGMAFVLVQHLAPQHPSLMRDLIARQTHMNVAEAGEGTVVEPNHVYVIPPNANLGLLHGRLHLVRISEQRAPHMPINFFFHSLAKDQGNRAVGVVLSGAATDGTQGLKAIKAEGGITFAQTPATAAYPSMPESAISAGAVDLVLAPKDIAKELVRLARAPFARPERALPEDSLGKIFFLVKHQTGHDFSYYKEGTVVRRLHRRMQLHKLTEIGDYVQYLERSTEEVQALFEDLLIHVTGFFREPQAFDALKDEVFPRLFKERRRPEPIRIWVPACSSGEEAYSIAIALVEYLEGANALQATVQIFASDIDQKAIEIAREGVYPESAISDLSSERLARFFTPLSGGFRVRQSIRSLCVFATQDIVKDPPFGHMDLISCRNLLIYLNGDVQTKVGALLHYALNPGGFLFLGSSETVGADLFSLIDQKHKIYQKKHVEQHIHYPFAPLPAPLPPSPQEVLLTAEPRARDPQRAGEEALISEYSPPAVIINEQMEITGFAGRMSMFLEPALGPASFELSKQLRRDLAMSVRAVVRKAIHGKAPVRQEKLRYQRNGKEDYVNVSVSPIPGRWPAGEYWLVVFEPVTPATPALPLSKEAVDTERERLIRELQQELANTRQQMQSMLGEQTTYNEELQAANEEIRSSNEELQSTNEELESAKEELQSTNEELATLNEELAMRNLELETITRELNSLLRSERTPILLVDSRLMLRHFTPPARQLFNLIDSDYGRPLSHLKPNVEIPDIERHLADVVDSGRSHRMDVRDKAGRWYSLRILPYEEEAQRTTGAVLMFIDLTELGTGRLAAIVQESNNAIVVFDLDGRIQIWNRGAEQLYGYTQTEALAMNVDALLPPSDKKEIRQLINSARGGEPLVPYETRRRAKDGRIRDVWVTVSVLRDADGKPDSLASTEHDITEWKRHLERADRLAAVARDSNDAITVRDFEDHILAWNPSAERLYGYSEAEALRMSYSELIPQEARSGEHQAMERLRRGEHLEVVKAQRVAKDGRILNVSLTASLLLDANGDPRAITIDEREVSP